MKGFIFGGFLSTVLGQSAFAPPARSQVNLPPYKSNEIISSLITQNVKNGQNTNLDKFKEGAYFFSRVRFRIVLL
jgi:hypothetical protein